jgi:hypothetical protein
MVFVEDFGGLMYTKKLSSLPIMSEKVALEQFHLMQSQYCMFRLKLQTARGQAKVRLLCRVCRVPVSFPLRLKLCQKSLAATRLLVGAALNFFLTGAIGNTPLSSIQTKNPKPPLSIMQGARRRNF